MPTQQFSKFGFKPELISVLNKLNICAPTEVQELTIPVLIDNKNDIVALAKTGTGKTLAYCLPILQKITPEIKDVQALILAPTRELGQQILSNIEKFSTELKNIKTIGVFGGIPIKSQIEMLQASHQIVVATPGRLVDLLSKNVLSLANCKFLILDEADEMATAHAENLEKIMQSLPKTSRKWLFSATMPGVVKQLIQNFMQKNAVTINADTENVGNAQIEHQYVLVDAIEKLDVLMHFLSSREGERGIIFCKTKAAVNKLAKNLAINKFKVGALHGSLTQPIRDRIMDQFRAGNIDLLVATDLASRGLDIPEVRFVINYHFPDVPETFVHRTGRTARAGQDGFSLTILQPEEQAEIEVFEKALGLKFTNYEKPKQQNLTDNNAVLWAKQIFKAKPNHDLDLELKSKIKTIFHHLTKDELIEKLVGNFYLNQKK